jgi:mRNA-degrading endonuclease toxin of MazEF toxin-antitoxin module
MPDQRPERGRIYRWPRNRSFGDSKPRPVLVISPEAATRQSQRWVVVPLSSDPRLQQLPLAVALEPDQANGLQQTSYAMGWLPTAVERRQLGESIGRVHEAQLKRVLHTLMTALDLMMQEPWQPEPALHSR